MTVFTDAIATGLAQLTRIVDAPAEPFQYGTDLSCVTDLTEDLLELDPNSPLGIAQSLIRRLTCPRGALPDDKNYGYDLVALLNRGASDADLREYAAQIRGECKKDDRVDDAQPTLNMNIATRTLSVQLQIKPEDPALRDFTLIFAVTSAGVVLESIAVS